jgi:hypothetical protein
MRETITSNAAAKKPSPPRRMPCSRKAAAIAKAVLA